MEKNQASNQEENFSELQNLLEKKRNNINLAIEEFSELLKNINNIPELQVKIYSYRQIILEDKFKLMDTLSKLNQIWRREYSKKFDEYTFNSDYRYDKEQKENKIINDLKNIYFKRELLKNQLDFVKDSISTIDNLIYGIKYRIQIEEWRRTM